MIVYWLSLWLDLGVCLCACGNVDLSPPSERLGGRCLGELDAPRIHLNAIQERRKALIEARHALVNKLQVLQVLLEVGKAVIELLKGGSGPRQEHRVEGRGCARARGRGERVVRVLELLGET